MKPRASAPALALALALGALAQPAPANAQANAPNPDTPQLKPLDNFAGSWKIEIDENMSGSAEANWVLGGRYLEYKTRLVDSQGRTTIELRHLYTYDKSANIYRAWIFSSSDDFTAQGEAEWDDARKTLTSHLRGSNSQSMKIVADFSESNLEKWTIQVIDANGVKQGEIAGTNRRIAR